MMGLTRCYKTAVFYILYLLCDAVYWCQFKKSQLIKTSVFCWFTLYNQRRCQSFTVSVKCRWHNRGNYTNCAGWTTIGQLPPCHPPTPPYIQSSRRGGSTGHSDCRRDALSLTSTSLRPTGIKPAKSNGFQT